MRLRHHDVSLFLLAAAVILLLAAFGHPARKAQEDQLEEARDLTAKSRLLPSVGAGVETVRRDSRGRYGVLATPGQSIRFYGIDGKLLEEIPASKSKHSLISDAVDFDVDAQGSLFVADRGANAIKVLDATGKLLQNIPFQTPDSVVALSKGEFAATGLRGNHLVEIFSADGKLLREVGELAALAEHEALSRYLNLGRLATDDAGNVYYIFSYMPEPSVRKYGRDGSMVFDVSLTTLEFQPGALAMRREIVNQDQRGSDPAFKMIINAIGVDRHSEHVWLALGSELLELDANGDRVATYRAITAEGASLRPVSILVEQERLVLTDNHLGIYEFGRPNQKVPEP
jgi:hypothetical protein